MYLDEQPLDYNEKLKEISTCNWVSSFHKDFITLVLTDNEVNWLRKAFETGHITGRFPRFYEDYKEDLIKRFSYLNPLFEKNKYFVRTNTTSCKYGVHGIGPYNDLDSIIESLVTSPRKRKPFVSPVKIYLLEWKTINPNLEFRVFVYKKNITAISQYHHWKENKDLQEMKPEEINNIAEKIIEHYSSTVKDAIKIDSYVYDVAYMGPTTDPYFIELGTFGKGYISRAAMFDWVKDDAILKGDGSDVPFRYLIT